MKRAILIIGLLAIVALAVPAAADDTALSVRVTVQTANLRSGPEMTASVVQTAKAGAVFAVVRKAGEWYLIQIPGGGQAYIHSTVVEEVADPAGTPAQTPAPQAKPKAPAATAPPAAPATAPAAAPRPSQAPAAPGASSEPRIYVRVNYGLGFQDESKALSFNRTQYYESAGFGLDYMVKKSGAIDAAVGYMLGSSLGVEVGASITTRDITESLTLSVPHPLWMGVPREGTIDASGLKLSETDIYLNLVYNFRFSMFGLSLYGGPCFMMSSATIVTDIATEEKGYPYTELNATQTSAAIKKNVFGFDAGAALSVNLGSMFAVFLDGRYVMGSAGFKPEGDIPELKIGLGGFRAGGGLKLRF